MEVAMPIDSYFEYVIIWDLKFRVQRLIREPVVGWYII